MASLVGLSGFGALDVDSCGISGMSGFCMCGSSEMAVTVVGSVGAACDGVVGEIGSSGISGVSVREFPSSVSVSAAFTCLG
jgi:hypothetical protein